MASATLSGVRPPARTIRHLAAARFAIFQSASWPVPPNFFADESEIAASRRNELAELCERNCAKENCGSVRNALITGTWRAQAAVTAADSRPWIWTALRCNDFASAMTEEDPQFTKTPTVETSAGILRRIFQTSAGAMQRALFS